MAWLTDMGRKHIFGQGRRRPLVLVIVGFCFFAGTDRAVDIEKLMDERHFS